MNLRDDFMKTLGSHFNYCLFMLKNTQQLLDIMSRLRNPEGGCAWDIKQDFTTRIG